MALNPKTAEIVAKAKARLLVLQQEARERIAASSTASNEALPRSGSAPTQSPANSSNTTISIPSHSSFSQPALSQQNNNEGAQAPQLLSWHIDQSRSWDANQQSAIHNGLSGKSFCLIGAAGTGKTTTLKGLVNSLMLNNILPPFTSAAETKWLKAGKPGIVLCSFTNMAVRQIAKHFSKDITTITAHKLLEFQPIFYDVIGDDGLPKTTMRFEATRNKFNKLPAELRTIVVDEATMLQENIVQQIMDALPFPDRVQWIFLGDLNQLPPVYGNGILGRKLLTLPVVELTNIYRQALLSPIITLATQLKNGSDVAVTNKVILDNGEHGKVTIHPWSKPLHWDDSATHAGALTLAANHMKAAINAGNFNPFTDMILCPYNVNFGVVELNSRIAHHLAVQRNAVVHEVIAGFNKHYYAVGDKVLVQKREAIITKIQKNRSYFGKRPLNPDTHRIDRWGGSERIKGSDLDFDKEDDFDIDAVLSSLTSSMNSEVEDRKTVSSHQIFVRFKTSIPIAEWKSTDSLADNNDPDYEETILESASEVNEMLFSYAITVHKSQGSEWPKVYLLLHSSHHAMCSRELVYTAVTRAAKELYIICEPDRPGRIGTLTKASRNPRLVGNTLEQKLASLRIKFEKERLEQQSRDAKSESDSLTTLEESEA
jgi:ATP-dependent exoDNAse (exonuclease V) alpha subunit